MSIWTRILKNNELLEFTLSIDIKTHACVHVFEFLSAKPISENEDDDDG